jgi:quercetin dioxygenase-like cupin family protein
LNVRTPSDSVIRREVVAEGTDVRVTIYTLTAGDSVRWHYHNKVTDDMIGMEGTTVVETRAPRNTYVLEPGQRCTIGPKTAHRVHGKDGSSCRYLVVQGVGAYDFIPVGG